MDHLHRLATLHQRVHSVLRGVNHLSTHRGGRIGAPNLELMRLGPRHRRVRKAVLPLLVGDR